MSSEIYAVLIYPDSAVRKAKPNPPNSSVQILLQSKHYKTVIVLPLELQADLLPPDENYFNPLFLWDSSSSMDRLPVGALVFFPHIMFPY